jgi:hypothetical protein
MYSIPGQTSKVRFFSSTRKAREQQEYHAQKDVIDEEDSSQADDNELYKQAATGEPASQNNNDLIDVRKNTLEE